MSAQPETIEFGEWLPDLPEYASEGALLAKNVIPQLKSFGQLNSLSAFSNALGGVCLGSFWVQDASNVIFNFAGDATKLYRLIGGVTWADVSGASAPFAATSWDFTKFGNRVIAVSKESVPQRWDLASSSTFAALAGSPPSARWCATVRDFVMLGDLSSLGPNFVQWSGYNNSELWTPSLSTQSDFQELFGKGGRVQRIVSGGYGQIFCEHSIFRADYAGPPVVFQIDEVETKRGTPAPYSVVPAGAVTFYYGWDGFYMFDGRASEPISANKVSKWFLANASADGFRSMRGVLDRKNRLVIWAFRTSSSSPINNRLLIFNWVANKWAYAELDTEVIDEYVSPGFTLDDLDTPLPGGIDINSINVDSDQFAGGALNLQAFDSLHRAATFDGAPLTATLDTREIGSGAEPRLFTNNVRPLVEGTGVSTLTVQVGTRNKLQDAPGFTLAKGLNPVTGQANIRANSRYQRFRVNISGGFSNAVGVQIPARASGGSR